ncbi:SMI1/KNR4 family protein [Streptomyces sp. NBC_00513]|uniref:SMI1/KNR4 family protein n=1 Tax=unclassified Streptomyces TaxID=2593676 RepID=UPI002258BABC|nr:SMI1/KNR4 family protein [Streptomyces sp. NBC_00424]MCX5072340.1 SMI1/KNR4 family protein [Streptomyces sp. NBC_00424]WUD44315.1 SMI1/KNR4 family protein [Streptomyces sp. NBC_00513]
MNPTVERLTQLIPPPQESAARDWADIQGRLGHALPEDYKELIDLYGGGLFDETIWVLEPDCEDKNYDLYTMVEERAEVLARLWGGDRGEPKPRELASPGTGLVPFAYIEGTGAFLYWLTREGQDPADWTVMADAGRGPEWESYPAPCVEFIVSALTGEIRTDILSELPADTHEFESNDDIL